MHRSTLSKLLALFISGSILFSSVPVYAEETTSLTESVTEEASAEPDYTADNSGEDVNGLLPDEDIAGESLADTVDESREISADPDFGSTTGNGSNTLDSRTGGSEATIEERCADSGSETFGNEANVEEGCADSGSETNVKEVTTEEGSVDSASDAVGNEANVEDGRVDSASETTVGGADTPSKSDGNTGDSDTPGKSDGNSDDSDTPDKNDTSTDDPETYGEQNSFSYTIVKKESFAHLYYDDVNDPAYDELRKELDEIFQNAQLEEVQGMIL